MDFIDWIVEMNSNHGQGVNITEDVFHFIEYFGTHFIRLVKLCKNIIRYKNSLSVFPSDIKFGARFSYIFSMNSSSYDALSNQGFDVEAAGSYSGFGFSVNAEASMTENQKAHSTEFNKHVEVFTTSVSAGSFFCFFLIINV